MDIFKNIDGNVVNLPHVKVVPEGVPNPITSSAMASMFGSTEAAIKYNLIKAKEAAIKGDAEEVKRYMQNISIIADFTNTLWSV